MEVDSSFSPLVIHVREDNKSRTIINNAIYEWYFEYVLGLLQDEVLIDRWDKSEPNSELDANGIDYQLYINGDVVPLQLTSTSNEGRKRMKRHPEIPVVYVRARRKDDQSLRSEQSLMQSISQKVTTYVSQSNHVEQTIFQNGEE
ncbi:hypothetical protein HY469_00515 [Candidatus Roizmanbacteria bacterium]|nr:hypothetical protein [Candidatus Roizmanbacteria bacterium]